jgi:hypothetical protein
MEIDKQTNVKLQVTAWTICDYLKDGETGQVGVVVHV